MNIKLHLPQNLKAGKEMIMTKQFLLSLIATTISILLTFGTSGIIEYKKKQNAKREIVMMVMYDLYSSLKSVEAADTSLHEAMDTQLLIAQDTAKFEEQKFRLASLVPSVNFAQATERIFSSSIETINIVGNVLFTESVANFYLARGMYKEMVCDSIAAQLTKSQSLMTLKGALDFDYCEYAMLSSSLVKEMRHYYQMCREIMGVSDKELLSYKKEREQVEENISGGEVPFNKTLEELVTKQQEINEAKQKSGIE